MLIGYLGQDPAIRYLENNRIVATFNLATNETFRDKNGERKTETEWHLIEMWDQLAKHADELKLKGLLKTGTQLYVEGKIKTEIYRDKNGMEHSRKKIKLFNFSLLGVSKPHLGEPPLDV